jgi:hypothetical protein
VQDQISKLIHWADGQILAAEHQRETAERRITEMQTFKAVLGQASNSESPVTVVRGNGEVAQEAADTFPAYIAQILRTHGPMRTAGVVEVIEKEGYPLAGDTPISTRVSVELSRQARFRRHGIRRVATGLYAAE